MNETPRRWLHSPGHGQLTRGVDMHDRTCEVCGTPLIGRQTRFCSRLHARRVHKREARKRGAAWAQNAPTSKRMVDLVCFHCGAEYEGYKPSVSAQRKRTYCSDGCFRAARSIQVKADPRTSACPHGTNCITTCPACTFTSRITATRGSIRQVVRRDPCSYCNGAEGGLDHITATADGGEDEWTNWTSACPRCNSIKGALPLMLALLWMPTCREYHDMRRVIHN